MQRCATQKTGVANENMQMIGQMCARHVKSPFASRVKALQSRPQQMPVRALSNNLWTGFAAPLLAEERVSYLEAILASPCMLSLVCFSLETQYGNVMLEGAQQQRFRVGARGNITLFPLPLEGIFQELHRQPVQGMKLPWVGREIAHAVRVVLRTSEVTDARVIAQARVRRDIVVRLIEDAVRRKHPTYANVQMEEAWNAPDICQCADGGSLEQS